MYEFTEVNKNELKKYITYVDINCRGVESNGSVFYSSLIIPPPLVLHQLFPFL